MTRLTELSVGDHVESLTKTITRPQLFRYSAATWNSHRIHYDPEYAREEGHDDILVQAHLHGAFLQELLLDWVGPDGTLTELSWKNVGPATPQSPLHVGATITAIQPEHHLVRFDVWTETNDTRCAEGEAVIEFPRDE